jgi:hypothetical protein
MDNTKLARFITSLGSLNGYGSTVAQTKRALDIGSSKPLNQNNDDVAIFEDALSGIKAIKKIGLTLMESLPLIKVLIHPLKKNLICPVI